MDEARAEALSERIFTEMVGGMGLLNPLGRFFYNVSVLHCLPQAMVFPEAAGTGAAISESTVRTYAHKAGYSKTSVLDIENPFFRFYKLTP